MHRAIHRSEYFSIVNAIVEVYQSEKKKKKNMCMRVRVCEIVVCIRESMPNADRKLSLLP